MTNAEALALKPGDRVEVKDLHGRKWFPATVRRAFPEAIGRFLVSVLPDGVTRTGRRRPWRSVQPRRLRPAPHLDPFLGNVFSDWLEEHGYTEAASALRKAFPLADGRPQEEVSRP